MYVPNITLERYYRRCHGVYLVNDTDDVARCLAEKENHMVGKQVERVVPQEMEELK